MQINTVVVGYGLAGRAFHCPLVARKRALKLHGVVARSPEVRAHATNHWGTHLRVYPDLTDALDDPEVQLIVIATPHDTHARLAIQSLESGKHCVVDKVMALTTAEADAMIAARDRSGRMLSVFHNRRWDWDFATVRHVLNSGMIGRPILIESSVCRWAPPKGWRKESRSAGTILHDWGAHLVDQALMLNLGPCLRLSAWIASGPWEGVDSGGHGRILLEFDEVQFQIETSRICPLDRPRWWILGTEGGFTKHGIDPQETALRNGDIDQTTEPSEHVGVHYTTDPSRNLTRQPVPTARSHWDGYYANIAAHLNGQVELEVTAEQAREVVRLLEAAVQSARENRPIEGLWGVRQK